MDLKGKASETAYALTKGAISSVPVVGSIGAELFSVVVTDPASKRRD